MFKGDFSDETLAELAAKGDKEAMSLLVSRITPIAVSKAAAYGNDRISVEDLVQEGMLGFLYALKRFDGSKGVPFKAYASVCINNRIVSAVRNSLNSKNIALSQAVLLDSDEYDCSGLPDPADIVSDNEAVEMMAEFLKNILSDFEKNVLRCRLCGKNYRETAAELGCDEKSVDNAIQRIRRKFRSEPPEL